MASRTSYSQTDLVGKGVKSNTEKHYSSAGGTTKYVFDRNTNQRYAIGSMAITAFNEDSKKMSVDEDPYAETEQVIVNSDSQVMTSSLNASGKFNQNSSTIQTDKSPGEYVNQVTIRAKEDTIEKEINAMHGSQWSQDEIVEPTEQSVGVHGAI